MDVRNVKCAMLTHPSALWFINADRFAGDRYGTKMSPDNVHVAVTEAQHHIINPANSRGALDDRIEDRLYIGGRAADDTEHLRCCGLMLQRLAEFRVAFLEFFEEADILDRDDCLASECFEQFDLSLGKRTNLRLILITPIGVPSLNMGALRNVRSPRRTPSL